MNNTIFRRTTLVALAFSGTMLRPEASFAERIDPTKPPESTPVPTPAKDAAATAWISLPEPEEAEVKKIGNPVPTSALPYLHFRERELLDSYLSFNSRAGSLLSPRETYLVVATVAGINHCAYCRSSAAAGLRTLKLDEKEVQRILNTPASGAITHRDKTMLAYARKLTASPATMDQADLKPLKDVGWSDREIAAIAMVVSWYNYKTRMAKALGYGPDALHKF